MSEINNYDPNNYDPNPYDDVTIDEALAQIYDRVNDRTIRQIVTILKKVIDGISTGDISRYTVEKTTAESGEVTYKLMQQINNGIPTPVGDTVSLRGSQILANYDEELQILDNIINIIKVALDSKADATDIPTVPITSIQKNDTTIMPVDGTVNITVPVVATDVAALPDTTKYAAALSLTIDSATFIVTGQLKDQNGNNLGAAQTIDLPLESVVVGGSYNSQTQKVVLTLQNGNTIEFSVADLVYGLQTELSETNKLNPAYINYDSTHRAVSDTEKSEWNGKQDVIDSSHKLSADFVDDTNAANKFATEEELEQIETNKNNISYLENTGKKNWLKPVPISGVPTGITVQYESDDSITINGTYSGSKYAYVYLYSFAHEAMQYTFSFNVTTSSSTFYFYTNDNKMSTNLTPTYTYTEIGTTRVVMRIAPNTSFDNVNVKLMIRPSIITDTTYQPYAMSNAELTVLSAEDRASLVELVDSGAKNLLKLGFSKKIAINQTAEMTADGNGVVINGSRNSVTDTILVYDIVTNLNDGLGTRYTLPAGEYIMTKTGDANVRLQVYAHDGTNSIALGYTQVSDLHFEYTNEMKLQYPYLTFRIWVSRVSNFDNFTFYPMICTKTAWDISQAYQPYRPIYQELYEMVKALQANQ